MVILLIIIMFVSACDWIPKEKSPVNNTIAKKQLKKDKLDVNPPKKQEHIELNPGMLEDLLFSKLIELTSFPLNKRNIKEITVENYILESYRKLLIEEKSEEFTLLKLNELKRTNYNFMECYNYNAEDEEFRMGTEFKCPKNKKIFSPSYGVVLFLEKLEDIDSNFIIIKHDFEYFKGFVIFAGIDNINVKINEKLNYNSVLGYSQFNSIFVAVYNSDLGFVDPNEYTRIPKIEKKVERKKQINRRNEEVSKTVKNDLYNWPIKNPKITSRFGYRKDPFSSKNIEFHTGIDLVNGNPNAIINPISSGKVIEVQKNHFRRGNYISVKHPKTGYVSRYSHLSEIYVKKGDYIIANTPIGKMGSTGRSTGPHLHLSLMKNGKIINPMCVLKDIYGTYAMSQKDKM